MNRLVKYLILSGLISLVFGCGKASDGSKRMTSPGPHAGDGPRANQDGTIRFRNVSNWKVGDALIYTVENAYTPGEISYSIRQVTFDTGDAFWLCGDGGYSTSHEISKLKCNPIQQYLVRKSDGVAIKEYTGLGGFSEGPFKNFWFVDSEVDTQLNVPFGTFGSVMDVKGKFYPYGGREVVNPINPTVVREEYWYASGLPLDGLVQEYVEQPGSKPLYFKLLKAVRGSGENPPRR